MNTTSESLLMRLQAVENSSPDQSAWKRFVELYAPLIYYWARKTGLRQSEASDLVQEVLTLVFQKLPGFRYDPSRSFRGWLRTVTLNKYRETRRRMSSRMVTASASVLDQLAPMATAESTWDIDYARLLVAQAMESMRKDFAPATWKALTLVIAESKTADQAAAETNVSVWTIYSAKSRLMKRLRDELQDLL